jgi:hypothetical protein
MSRNRRSAGALVIAAAALLVAACTDAPTPLGPPDDAAFSRGIGQDIRAMFNRASPEVMALPQTVFAAVDERSNQIVFGVENRGVFRAVENAMNRLGMPAEIYRIEVTEPIHFASDNLRSRHRPTVGGLQIHWSQYVCTLGFNVDHSGGRSFITNSHCTDQQGTTGNTAYYQPASSVDSSPIAFEAHDPAYTKSGCSQGKVCRESDAARALYQSTTGSARGAIAKPTGLNTGSLAVAGSLTIASQDNDTRSFQLGATMHKVGRTTGWTSGVVTSTCATVNVFGSNIQLRCQTIVDRPSDQSNAIVGGGDSGSPVFTITSGDNVRLVGILWGGSGNSRFVFSPLNNIQNELGAMTATADGSGGGTGDGGGGGGGDDNGGTCIPRGPNGNNCK